MTQNQGGAYGQSNVATQNLLSDLFLLLICWINSVIFEHLEVFYLKGPACQRTSMSMRR